jgi:hypothetical protein
MIAQFQMDHSNKGPVALATGKVYPTNSLNPLP